MKREKIVNISISENVFNQVAILAKENKRSVRAEIAVIVEDRIREINKTK